MLIIPLLFILIPTLLFTIAFLFLLLFIALYRAPCTTGRTSLGRSAAVVVLGDVGRSPRMCYHIESLADQGWKVSVVGYPGSKLPNSIQRSSVKFHKLSQVPSWIARLPRLAFIAVAPLKLLWQSISLFWNITMVIQPPPEIILVQTPPALPTLFIVRISSLLLSSRVVIDWHNLAYTILALRLGSTSPLVSLAKWLERITGRTAFAHLFVTHSMKNHLDSQWRLQGHKAVLHDRPPKHFRKANIAETHLLWKGLAGKMYPSLRGWWPDHDTSLDRYTTPFTALASSGKPRLRSDRPALAVSSTSWTADEDFGLLLRAAQLYEKRARLVNSGASAKTTNRGSSFPSSPSHKRSSGVVSSSRDTPFSMLNSEGSEQTADIHTHSHNSSTSSQVFSASTSASSLGPPPQDQTSPAGHGHSHSNQSLDISPSGSLNSFRTNTPTSHRLRRPSNLFQPSSALPNCPAAALPKLLIVVTGKGELRAQYEREIEQLEKKEDWQWVRIRTAWLENWEYPLLLGSADVGISLHSSSSGLDLPMKVVDMLGCHLPVLALDFPCLGELVQQGRNGLKFGDDQGLEEGLESLLGGFPYEDGSDGNWLVQSGGLSDPFAHAGHDLSLFGTEADEEGRSSDDLRPTSPTSRQSLDVFNSFEDSEDQRHRMKRSSFEFSKGGLPTSQSYGPGAGSTQTTADSTSSGPSSGRVSPSALRIYTSPPPPLRPSTPTPHFTMLASPVLGQGEAFFSPQDSPRKGGTGKPEANSWSQNWKATVRPLLRLADVEDAEVEGSSLSDEEDLEDLLLTVSGDSHTVTGKAAEGLFEEDADELTALLPSPQRGNLSRSLSSSSSSLTSKQSGWSSPPRESPSRQAMRSFRFGGGEGDEDDGEMEVPVRRGGGSLKRHGPHGSRRRRLGSDGRVLRIRGGSVHGLLWAEDFRMSSGNDSMGTLSVDSSTGVDAGDEDDDEEDGIELGLFGSVVNKRAGDTARLQRRRRQASSRKGSLSSTLSMDTPRASVFNTLVGGNLRQDHPKKQDGEDVGGEEDEMGSTAEGSGLSAGPNAPRHLRKRTAAGHPGSSPQAVQGASRRESVPDIWVSTAEDEGGAGGSGGAE